MPAICDHCSGRNDCRQKNLPNGINCADKIRLQIVTDMNGWSAGNRTKAQVQSGIQAISMPDAEAAAYRDAVASRVGDGWPSTGVSLATAITEVQDMDIWA